MRLKNSLFPSGCKEGHFGDNCGELCTCEIGNTETCNPDNGTCTCKTGWQGDDCSLDVNECVDIDPYLCPANSFCENTNGSYRCKCDKGFEKSGSLCIGISTQIYCKVLTMLNSLS